MSRSAADATRFTATGPYANSKTAGAYQAPDFGKKTSSPQQLGPSGQPETPKEKVERLRAQARAARNAQAAGTGTDRWIESGRRFANKAHKGMVYSLIAASGVCGVLTVYSMISLTLYNRRQRTLWIEKELETLKQAEIACANGTATIEQEELLKKERIGDIMKQKREEEKAQKPWAKAKRFLFEKLNMEDTGATAAPASAPVLAIEGAEHTQGSVMDAVQAKQALDAAAKTGAPVPGQLDVMAENVEQAAKAKTSSWTGWLTGR
ncbi:hypothetical protein N7491_008967 [Penicillium cf. griseofulvum]|uniref:Cytochrome oxidase c assembly-domain-containing protein n=1 Tax=Penicillium cf. griseofulvum TaxID=2972120 RepID=A0A9W9JNF9_9EURO|nr:hypothetical protein N7472_005437 [Penicillium cf. griseofulvum]KAJ5423751.1 hypothetical protein N7491_008967 [Penicillium cf. griseofulvum]KAJ5430996.1 hypothetical protein N7445_008728 [Penicillium cf. griseofulvum]